MGFYGVSVVRGVMRTAQSGHHALVLIWIIVPFVRLTLFGPPTAALWAPRLFRCTQAWDLHWLLLTHQECLIALGGLLGPPLAAIFGNLLSVLLCVLVPDLFACIFSALFSSFVVLSVLFLCPVVCGLSPSTLSSCICTGWRLTDGVVLAALLPRFLAGICP